MKIFLAVLMLVAISGCINTQPFPKVYSPELAHKCQTDPYGFDCLHPPAVLHN